MKVEQSNNPNLTAIKQSTKAEPTKTAAPRAKEGAAEVDKTGSQAKIQRWFARAGVKPTNLGLQEETDKRVRRHQSAKLQRKIANLERVLELALEFSIEDPKDEDLDPDWFFNFVDMAEDIHSAPMQELWGKIFALEVGRPGSFSLRTLQILKQLTHKDARTFRKAVNLASKKKGDASLKLIFGYYQKPSLLAFLSIGQNHQLNLSQQGLAYPDILTLMDLGLMYKTEIESAEQQKNVRTVWRCGAHTYHLAANRKGLILNYYKFTSSGNELARLINANPPQTYLDSLRDILSSGFEIN